MKEIGYKKPHVQPMCDRLEREGCCIVVEVGWLCGWQSKGWLVGWLADLVHKDVRKEWVGGWIFSCS